MAAEQIRQNDIGTQFLITIKDDGAAVDISGASVKQLIFQKPKAFVRVVQNANFYTDGTDGKMFYTSVSGDLDTLGTWKIQGILQIGTSVWSTDIHTFDVFRNL
jgi:hypothetical protein